MSVAEDRYGNILVGTESGLGLLDVVSENCAIVSKSDETISKVKVEQSGLVWWLTANGNLYKVPPLSKNQYGEAVLVAQLRNQKWGNDIVVNTFDIKSLDEIVVGTNKGLLTVNKTTGYISVTGLTQNITAVLADKNGGAWIGTSREGLFFLEKNNSTYRKIDLDATNAFVNQITALKLIDDHSLLVCTIQNVFSVAFDAPAFSVTRLGETLFPNRESYITTAFADRTRNILLGSQIGLYKMKKKDVTAEYISPDSKEFLPNNQITNLHYTEDGYLWIQTSMDGVFKMNTQTQKQTKLSIPIKNVRCLKKSKRGSLILTSGGKVYAYNEGGGFKTLYESNSGITDIVELNEGEWWATSWTGGLIRFFETPNDSVKSTTSSIFAKVIPIVQSNNAHAFCIAKDREQGVWVGTRGNGIYKIHLANQTIEHYDAESKKSKASNRILCIKEDRKGNIWVGTRGDGLLLYQRNGNYFKVFDTKNGLLSNTICAIEENKTGELWLSTLNGLAKIKDLSLPFQSFGDESGIKSPEFLFNVSAADAQGYLYFGNVSGVYRIKESDMKPTTQVPLVWTRFEILNTKRPQGENTVGSVATDLLAQIESNQSVQLEHDQNTVRIGFALLDFTTPEKNQYAYRLIGKDTAWQFTEGVRPMVEYVDLKAGDYAFEVRAANSYGEWKTITQSFKITILLSFWRTRTAFALYFGLFTLLGIGGYILWRRWFNLNKKLHDEMEVTQLHSQQMVFYTDLSHEIKNRLSLILGPLELALHDKKVNSSILNNLYDQTLRLKKLTDQIMNIRKGEKGTFILSVAEENIKSKFAKLSREAEPLAVLKNIKLSFTSQKETLSGWYDEELLEIIIQNLLNNAIKYCKIGGQVSLKIDAQYLGETDLPNIEQIREGNFLICTVQDTGVGIPQAEIDKVIQPFYRAENTKFNRKDLEGTGIGLDLVARLVKLHHGSLDIRSEEGIYTAVTIYIPIGKLQYNISELKPNIVHAPIVVPNYEPDFEETDGLILPQNTQNTSEEAPSVKTHLATPTASSRPILLVDDNREILKLLVDTLSSEFDIYTASNGQEALDMLKKQKIELIISDLSMPIMDGLTLCQRVREQKRLVDLPFIILTGRNSDEQKLVCFQNQVDDFIEKPFSPELLRWRVKSLLRTANSEQSKTKAKRHIEPQFEIEIKESEDDKFIQSIVNLIEQNLDKEFLDVEFLATNLYMSRATFYRKMEDMVGESPSLFIRKYRLKKAALMMKTRQYMVHEVAMKIGFSNPKYFSKCFEKEFGVTPTQFLQQN